MGCGESKHAVSTENTLTKSKSKSFKDNSPPAEKAKNDANVSPTTIQEPSDEVKGSAGGALAEKKIPEAIKDERLENAEVGMEDSSGNDKEGNENVKANATPIVVAKVEEYKGEEKGEEAVGETKGDEERKGVGNEKVEAEQKVDIADQEVVKVTPHEETIDSIIPDEISGKPGEYAPPAKGKTEENLEDEEAKPDAEKAAEEITKADKAEMAEAVDETEVSANEATPPNDVKAN